MPVIGRVGRLDPMKDYDTFLAAAAHLGRERSDVRFVIVGDGPARYRHRLEQRAEELGIAGRVQWCGAQQEMPAVFNAFHVATSSSSAFGEGFPNVLGEALACGVPCVTTDVGDSAAVLGGLGPVVPPGDPGRLASAWTESLSAARDTLGARLRSRIEHEFSVATMVDRTERALAGVAAS